MQAAQTIIQGLSGAAVGEVNGVKPNVAKDLDKIMISVSFGRIERLSFVLNDIQFHVAQKEAEKDLPSHVCIQAALSFLPFSIEDSVKRRLVFEILDATRSLQHVRFGLDHKGLIYAAARIPSGNLTAPDFVFYPLTIFLQEAQPFIDLIGQYL